ncbi:hypothetical protein V8D89_007513 [Ganoderma adspersum]
MTAVALDSSGSRRRRNVITDLLIGLGIPLLAVALCHRFNILEGVGCVEAYPNPFLSILLTTWLVLIGLASAIYAFFALRGMLNRTKDLKRLQTVETGLTDFHYDFGRVDSVPAVIWRQDAIAVIVVNSRIWTPISCAIFFFLLFGFTAEPRRHCKVALLWVARCCGVRRRRAPEIASRTVISYRQTYVDAHIHGDADDDIEHIGTLGGSGRRKSSQGSHQASPPVTKVENDLGWPVSADFPSTSPQPRYTTVLRRPPSVHLSSGQKGTLYILHQTAGLGVMDMARLVDWQDISHSVLRCHSVATLSESTSHIAQHVEFVIYVHHLPAVVPSNYRNSLSMYDN